MMEDVTWETAVEVSQLYRDFHLADQVAATEGGDVKFNGVY